MPPILPSSTSGGPRPPAEAAPPGGILRSVGKCRSCSAPLTAASCYVSPAGQLLEYCTACGQKAAASEAWGTKITENMNAEVDKALRAAGMFKRELSATWRGIPQRIREAFPEGLKIAVGEGRPLPGFGLIAVTGAGKTMAAAALVREWVRAQLAAWLTSDRTHTPFVVPFRWVCWPDFVHRLRSLTFEQVALEVELLSDVPLLVLDDLGRERMKGSYTEDWAASQLDALIGVRYRKQLPVIWTSNLTERALVELYGAALVSRLTEDNPAHELLDLPSLRIREVSK